MASYAFYCWWDWRFCGLTLISSLADCLVGLGLSRMLGTFAFISTAWVFFRTETLGEAGSIFKSMTGLATPQAALEVLASMGPR